MATVLSEPRAIEAAYLRKLRGVWRRVQQIIAFGLEPLLYVWPSDADDERSDADFDPPFTGPWAKTATGYQATTIRGVATLEKRGREWFLSYLGKETSLGRKAQFGHAEAVILRSSRAFSTSAASVPPPSSPVKFPRLPPRYSPFTAPPIRRRVADLSDSDLRRLWPGLDPADIRAYAPWAVSREEVERLASYGGRRFTAEQADRYRRGLPVSLSQDQLEGYVRDGIAAEQARTPQPLGPSHFGDPDLVRPTGAFQLRPPVFPVLLGDDGLPLPLPPRPTAVSTTAISRQLEWLEIVIGEVVDYEHLAPVIGPTGEQLNLFARNSLERVLAIDLRRSDPQLQAMIDLWRDRNVELIGSGVMGPKLAPNLRAGLLGDVSRMIEEAHAGGLRVERLAFDLKDRFGVSNSRAELIARDQVLKLNGQINRQRQMELGISKYRWVTSRDERVRESHARLDGTIQDWNAPPEVAPGRYEHPGGDYQCRCTASPIRPGEEQAALQRSVSRG